MNANSRKFQSILRDIRQPKNTIHFTHTNTPNQLERRENPYRPQRVLSQEELDEHCTYLDSCAGYYHHDNCGYYDVEGVYQGDFIDHWGDHPHTFEPEAFGLDEGVYRDFEDLTFWAGEKAGSFANLSSAKRLEKLEELVINYFIDQEELNLESIEITAEYIEEAYDPEIREYTEAIVIEGIHSKVGPVWSSIQKTVYFPADYPTVSNAVLDVHEHLEKIKNLTHGCPHCWTRHTLNPAEEVSDEYGYDLELVEDIIGACEEGELSHYGPIQPDCASCLGQGI